jgi:hypothetical protein
MKTIEVLDFRLSQRLCIVYIIRVEDGVGTLLRNILQLLPDYKV